MQPVPVLLVSEVDDGRFRLDVVVPSWCLSIVTHVLLFLAISLILRGCAPTGVVGPKVGEGSFRSVGLHVAPDVEAGRPIGAGDVNAVNNPQEAMVRDEGQAQSEPLVRDDPAISKLLNLPEQATSANGLPLLGPGHPASARSSSSAGELIKPSQRVGGGANGGGRGGIHGGDGTGLGETTFFDIAAQGNRFVYVLDRSGSMYDHNAIRVAKEELVASLSELEQTQQFQIIFYNTSLIEMRGHDDRPQMQWATEINRTLARQFISGIQPDGGTDHVPPLRKALRYLPEHLFFLTDADQPQLSARELNDIKTLNAGRTKIHCVEFGKGSELSVDNFLKKLARDNGGTYRYRDVIRFDRRSK